MWIRRSNLHEAPLFSPFSKFQVHILFWRSHTMDWFFSIFVSKDTSSAVLYLCFKGFSPLWAGVVVQGLGWWLRRSAFPLVIQKEKINDGHRVALAWPGLITGLRWGFWLFCRDQSSSPCPVLFIWAPKPLASVRFQQEVWNGWNSNPCEFTQIEGDARSF